VITYLRRGIKLLQNSSQEKGVRICKRNNSADTKVGVEGGGVGAPCTRADILLQPTEKSMVRQIVSLQPMEVNSIAHIHLQPMEDPMLEQVDARKGACDHVKSPRWSWLLAGSVIFWREGLH